MTFNDMVAQLAHIAWGALIFDVMARRIKIKYAALAVTSLFVVKEVLESTLGIWEPVQPWSSGFEDMAFWAIGLGLGYLIYKMEW